MQSLMSRGVCRLGAATIRRWAEVSLSCQQRSASLLSFGQRHFAISVFSHEKIAARIIPAQFATHRNSHSTQPPKIFPQAADFMPLEGTDFIEIYCSNAKQAGHYFHSVFGFQPLAYCGLETGDKEKTSYALQQGKVRLILTSSNVGSGEISAHVATHGDGVHKVALRVPDATAAFMEATGRGATAYMPPTTYKDENGVAVVSGIRVYGDTVHLFVERKNYSGFLPGFVDWKRPDYTKEHVGLKYIDHTVANVGWGQMSVWSKFYHDVFGMADLISFDDKDISTEYTALMSKVVTNGTGYVKFPINEPAEGRKRSQIEEYLDFYGGPGVQHIAIATDDIIKTVATLQKNGCEFLTIPSTYYETLHERCGKIEEDISELQKYNILVDRDDLGYMLQIFTKPLSARPTLFFEIIQRRGAQSFGKGNFKALFESIEAEQIKRGTL